METGRSTSSDLPLGLAARPRRVGTSDSFQIPANPRYGDFAAAGLYSKPEPPTNFLTYMNFLAEHKHEVPVISSVSELVDKDHDEIGVGATFAVFKGRWGEGKAAFKYLKDGIIPPIADRQDNVVAVDGWRETRRKRQYDSAMKSLMFEIKIMAKRPLSRHRNIIRLLGISWDEDKEVEQPALTDPIRPVLVVELAWEEYPDLASYASSKSGHPSRLTVGEALSIAADVSDGLAALHSFGVVHGDLKPANVLLFLDSASAREDKPGGHQSPHLVAKIGDFGYSGTVSSEDDVRGGTQFWNAPECLDSCDDKELKGFATHQTRDIYSFGLLLVYLWTGGGSPFLGIASSLAAVDRAKLDDRISYHCCTLVRNSEFSDVAGKVAVAVEDVVRDTLHRDPRLRCSNIGDVGPKLTSKEKTGSVEEVESFTRATFFSIRFSGAPEPMSYENIDLSNFWRGSEKQIPESRRRLLRRGVELDYINTLTSSERRGLFLAGHAFVNAERGANGQAPLYPRSSIHPDYWQNYPAEERLRLTEELAEASTNMDHNMLVGTGTKEESMVIRGLSYSYLTQGILGATVSLKTCIELNQPLTARLLLKLGQASVKEEVVRCSTFSLLHLAAMYNRPDFVHLLVKHGLDVNQRGGGMQMTPLQEAIRTGNFEATLALLDCGADLEAKIRRVSSVRSFTPLEFSILGPAIAPKVLSLLLERGAQCGHTNLSIATIEGSAARPSLLRVLLDHDDRLAHLETRQRKIIHAAVTANEPESVRMLLERGVDPNARDFKGRTPLALQSSVNRFGSFFHNGMYSDLLGKSRQLRPQMFNPEHWDEIRRLLIDHGGEEPDDYIETVGERQMMEAVASYIYWLSHLGTAFFRNPVISKLFQSLASGTASMDPAALYGLAIKHLVEHKRIVTGYLKSIHTLAEVTEHLPVGSAVLTVSFSADFKEYLAAWRTPVDWDGFMDFVISILRYGQDPKEPKSPYPEGLTEADLDTAIADPLGAKGPLNPQKRRLLEYVWNTSIPADYDAAMECMLSTFVPELHPGSLLPDEAREAFDKIKQLRNSFTEDPSAHSFAAVHDQLTQAFRPASAHPTAPGGAGRPSSSISIESNANDSNYQPSFLSSLTPSSPIYICSINTEAPALRKAEFGGVLILLFFALLLILWRIITWLQWMSLNRFTSLFLLSALPTLVQKSSTAQTDFSYLALVAVWLAHDRTWQIVLEYHLIKPLLLHILVTDPHKALTRQIALRWRHGFPDVEPLILSHADGREWEYNFAQLLEGLHGSHAMLTTRKGWIQRADAISSVLDEWKNEMREGRESTVEHWTNGWWFYNEGETENSHADAASEHDAAKTPRSGSWRKSTFVENSRPERWLAMYGRIEELCHSKGRPELYQRFRELFPKIVSGDTYRVLEREFAAYPDILAAAQGIFFE